MANITDTLNEIMSIDGCIAAALVDYNSGLVLGKAGSGINLDLAGAGNTEVVRAKMKTMKSLKLEEQIEDILITLDSQYHIIRPLEKKQGLFLYVVLQKERANLALARMKTADTEGELQI
ncbi:MAG: hypothetical protein Q4F49_03620 [Pseudoxanthomonas suwonensis]|nr:hypothetical protein [Pseudoxanthomonas suwonensis]